MKKNFLFIIAVFCFSFQISHAATCNASKAEQAEQAIDNLNSWDDIDNFFRKFRQCDDGSISEGTSEAIAQLMLKDWQGSMKAISKKSTAFRSFAIAHVNETLNNEDLEKIQNKAKTECTKNEDTLCKEIEKAAQAALKH